MQFFPEALQTPGFSWAAAASLVNACDAAYRSEAALRHLWAQERMEVQQVFSIGMVQGYALAGRGLVACVFRGTDSVADWLANLEIAASERPYGSVHRGFLRGYRAVAPIIVGLIERARREGVPFWLTGHSLGGAIGQIAAQEHGASHPQIGLYTFGQPRTANVVPGERLSERLGLLYHRVVNGMDYVPRVPPNFGHSGQLVQLGRGQELQAEGRGGGKAPAELPPIELREFREHQQELRVLRGELLALEATSGEAEPETRPGGREQTLDAAAQIVLPGIRDHRIAEYSAAILRHLPSEARKFETPAQILANVARPNLRSVGSIDPLRREDRPRSSLEPLPSAGSFLDDLAIFRTALPMGFGVERAAAPVPAAAPDLPPAQLLPLVVMVLHHDWAPPPPVLVQSVIGNFRTVLVPEDQLHLIQDDPSVTLLEPSRDAGISELDTSRPFVRCDIVQAPPLDERGKAALVGLIDSGIDILHEAFLDAAGQTRILAIWNQRDNSGPSPQQVDPQFSQSTGTLHLAPAIQQAIDDAVAGTAQPHWMLRDGGDGHGTHVAGIAAGRETAALGPGMAPEAGIVLVIPNHMAAAGDPSSLGYAMAHLDGLAFLKRVARGNTIVSGPSLPMAVNISSGMNAGSHDGSSALERAINDLVGQGSEPGFVIVKSAGNEQDNAGHASTTVFMGQMEIAWESDAIARDLDYFEAWFSSDDTLSFRLQNPLGNVTQVADQTTRQVSEVLDGNLCQMQLTAFVSENGDQRLALSISPEAADIRPGVWKLLIEGREVRSRDAPFHIWVERANARPVRFIAQDRTVTISLPGTADHVITVGACSPAPSPALAPSTSLGPTRRGAAKPEIVAPGTQVQSAQANGPSRHAVAARQGTSISAPHVTGVIALAMSRRARQGKAQFNTIQLQRMLARTARKVRPIHDPGFGHGILDAEAFLQLVDQQP